eukprot:scaffold16257_cov25-Phaeocystis_antarctica.AAC.1
MEASKGSKASRQGIQNRVGMDRAKTPGSTERDLQERADDRRSNGTGRGRHLRVGPRLHKWGLTRSPLASAEAEG